MDFLFNILNRGKPPSRFQQTENCSKIHKRQRSTFVLVLAWNVICVLQDRRREGASSYNYPAIERERADQRGGRTVLSHLSYPLHNNLTCQLGEHTGTQPSRWRCCSITVIICKLFSCFLRRFGIAETCL